MSWLFLSGCFSSAFSQEHSSPLLYHFHKITQTEGLSSYNVKKIIQDTYGYTWIATQDGLNRFDGKNITIYNKSADVTRRLVNSDIWDLAEDTTAHRLWVLSYSGLNCIDLTTGKVLANPPAIAPSSHVFVDGWFKCELLCGHRLWIGSNNYNGLTIYNTERQAFDSVEPLPTGPSASTPVAPNVDHLWRDEYDRVWAFVANYGIVLYSGATGRIVARYPLRDLGLPTNPDLDFDRFKANAPLGNGRMALLTNTGFYEIRYDEHSLRLQPFPLPLPTADPALQKMYTCATDPNGRLWFNVGDAFYRLDIASGVLTEVKDAKVNPENWFDCIYYIQFDSWGHIWLGTQKGVAFSSTTTSPFSSYFQSADFGTIINHANYPYPDNDTVLYVCAEDGFYRCEIATNILRRLAEGRFFYATRLKDGPLLVSGEHQLYVLRHDRLTSIQHVYPELAPIRNVPLNSLTWYGDTLAIMGRNDSHGICLWYPHRHTLRMIDELSRPIALGGGVVNTVYRDHRDRVWILSDVNCSIFDPIHGTIKVIQLQDPNTHLPCTFYFDVAEAHGLYWLAVYGTGLLGLDSNFSLRKVFSSREGFANNSVYKVFNWKDSLLFVTSNNGLSRIRLADSRVVNYFQKDGLHGNGFEESCGSFSDKYIYAGGERGISRIEPAQIPMDPALPPLRLGNVQLRTSGSVTDFGDIPADELTVPSDVVQAALTVFSFDYTDEGRTLLSYKISELKTQWIPLESGQTIDLFGLNPGKYTLLLKATNPNTPGSERNLSLQIEWLPKWYQTVWFKIAVVLVMGLLFYLFYRYRINTIKAQQLIRQNISSDLHDDIGSILNTIKIFTQLARRGPDTESWLSQIDTSLAQAVVALRDMIWVLDDNQDTVYQLLERIRQFALPLLTAHGVRLDISADGEITQRLSKEEKRHLLLIAKESVNNSIKYANCCTIGIRLEANGKFLSFRVEDDGAGFDPLLLTNGNGLKNIGRRAAKIHYHLEIASSPGLGSRITLTRV